MIGRAKRTNKLSKPKSNELNELYKLILGPRRRSRKRKLTIENLEKDDFGSITQMRWVETDKGPNLVPIDPKELGISFDKWQEYQKKKDIKTKREDFTNSITQEYEDRGINVTHKMIRNKIKRDVDELLEQYIKDAYPERDPNYIPEDVRKEILDELTIQERNREDLSCIPDDELPHNDKKMKHDPLYWKTMYRIRILKTGKL